MSDTAVHNVRQSEARGLTYGYLTVVAIAVMELMLPVPPNLRSEGLIKLAAVIGVIIVSLRPAYLLITGKPHPIKYFIDEIRANRAAILWSVVIYAALTIALETGTAIKKSIPILFEFHADPLLHSIDVAIFRDQPWRYTHALLEWATPAMAQLYVLWQVVQVGLAMWIAFSFNQRLKIQFALIFQLTWLINGGILATLFASVGPIMYGDFFTPNPYHDLVAQLNEVSPIQLYIKGVLIDAIGNQLIIGGISAMPSMHVAIALIFALRLQRLRIRVLTVLGWLYVANIYVSSIHLGWHYGIDGMVSAIVVLSLYFLTGRYVEFLIRRGLHDAAPALGAEPQQGGDAAEAPSSPSPQIGA